MKKTHLFRFLDTVGNGSGTKDATGNYSDAGSGSTDFLIAPTGTQVFVLERMIVHIKDTSGIDADKYGNNITLTNGITVTYNDTSGEVVDLLDGVNIFSNGDWARQCYDANLITWGSGNDIVSIRWTFSRAGIPLVLKGDEGDDLTVTLNDDFSGLLEHRFQVQGYSTPAVGYRDEYIT